MNPFQPKKQQSPLQIDFKTKSGSLENTLAEIKRLHAATLAAKPTNEELEELIEIGTDLQSLGQQVWMQVQMIQEITSAYSDLLDVLATKADRAPDVQEHLRVTAARFRLKKPSAT